MDSSGPCGGWTQGYLKVTLGTHHWDRFAAWPPCSAEELLNLGAWRPQNWGEGYGRVPESEAPALKGPWGPASAPGLLDELSLTPGTGPLILPPLCPTNSESSACKDRSGSPPGGQSRHCGLFSPGLGPQGPGGLGLWRLRRPVLAGHFCICRCL